MSEKAKAPAVVAEAMQEHQSKPRGRRNIYMCSSCGHGFITEDRDIGVTPFSMDCRHPGCRGFASSFFYNAPQEFLAQFAAAVIWYRPGEPEIAALEDWAQQHVRNGGLLPKDAK